MSVLIVLLTLAMLMVAVLGFVVLPAFLFLVRDSIESPHAGTRGR